MAKTASKKHDPKAEMARHLELVLADTYVLIVKTHGYHWNVCGPAFRGVHALLDEQYEALYRAADDIAERVRALGFFPEGSMASFLKNTVIKEAGPKPLAAKAILADLVRSHEQLCERLKGAADFADDIDDAVSEGLLVERLADHEKTIWMLRSHAG